MPLECYYQRLLIEMSLLLIETIRNTKEVFEIVSGLTRVYNIIRRVKADIDEKIKEQHLTSVRWCGNVYT